MSVRTPEQKKRDNMLARVRKRRWKQRQGQVRVRCVNCRHCRAAEEPGLFECGLGYWTPRNDGAVRRLHVTMATWCVDFALGEGS